METNRMGETPAQKVERDLANENRELRERVTELEWKLDRVRQAWRLLSDLADEPTQVAH